MRRQGRRASNVALLIAILCALLVVACGKTTSAANENLIAVGDCVSVTDLGGSDAAPVKRVPCGPPGTPFTTSAYAVYRVAISHTLEVPVTTRTGADDLANLYCHGPQIVPGSSLYVFPTEGSFAAGFKQFLCLVR